MTEYERDTATAKWLWRLLTKVAPLVCCAIAAYYAHAASVRLDQIWRETAFDLPLRLQRIEAHCEKLRLAPFTSKTNLVSEWFSQQNPTLTADNLYEREPNN